MLRHLREANASIHDRDSLMTVQTGPVVVAHEKGCMPHRSVIILLRAVCIRCCVLHAHNSVSEGK